MNGLAHAAAWERLVRARVAHILVFFLNTADVGHRVVADDRADFQNVCYFCGSSAVLCTV